MKFVALTACSLFILINVQGQNLIGLNPKEIKEYMKTNCKYLNYSNVVNSNFSYLKYSDDEENQTFLFFLGTDSVCNHMRIIYDRSLRNEKIRGLDTLYVKTGDNMWTQKREGKEYIIQGTDEKWSFIVNIDLKN